VGTQFHYGDLVEGACESARDGRGSVSVYVYAYGNARLAHVNSYVRARGCDVYATGCVRYHWRVVRRRVGAHYGSYYASHLHCVQTLNFVVVLLQCP
jgi:hypothetical protein